MYKRYLKKAQKGTKALASNDFQEENPKIDKYKKAIREYLQKKNKYVSDEEINALAALSSGDEDYLDTYIKEIGGYKKFRSLVDPNIEILGYNPEEMGSSFTDEKGFGQKTKDFSKKLSNRFYKKQIEKEEDDYLTVPFKGKKINISSPHINEVDKGRFVLRVPSPKDYDNSSYLDPNGIKSLKENEKTYYENMSRILDEEMSKYGIKPDKEMREKGEMFSYKMPEEFVDTEDEREYLREMYKKTPGFIFSSDKTTYDNPKSIQELIPNIYNRANELYGKYMEDSGYTGKQKSPYGKKKFLVEDPNNLEFRQRGGMIKYYQQGGKLSGMPHEAGGEMIVDDLGNPMAEAEGGEIIFSVETSSMIDDAAMAYAQAKNETEMQAIANEIGRIVIEERIRQIQEEAGGENETEEEEMKEQTKMQRGGKMNIAKRLELLNEF